MLLSRLFRKKRYYRHFIQYPYTVLEWYSTSPAPDTSWMVAWYNVTREGVKVPPIQTEEISKEVYLKGTK